MFGKRYAAEMRPYGIDVVLKTTSGSCENLRLLHDAKQPVDFAFVLGGSCDTIRDANEEKGDAQLVSLGSLFYEPVWVFYRAEKAKSLNREGQLVHLAQLKGWRVNVGVRGVSISCSDANTLTDAINRAVGRGVAVMCFDSDAPASKRFCYHGTNDDDCGRECMRELITAMGDKGGTVAILAGFSSVILVMLYGQSRVFFSMSNDGLVPKLFSEPHPKFRTPWKSNMLFFVFTAMFAGFLPEDIVGEMTSIGTLFAFILVCAGVWILRVRRPDLKRAFTVPAVPVVAILGIIVCGSMIYGLGWTNWLRLIVWLVIGLVFYFGYGRKHSKLATDPSTNPQLSVSPVSGD